MIENWHLGDYVSIGEEDYVCVMTRGHKDDTIVQEQIFTDSGGIYRSDRKQKKESKRISGVERRWVYRSGSGTDHNADRA